MLEYYKRTHGSSALAALPSELTGLKERDAPWTVVQEDGFELPKEILADPGCDLALALEIFYLGDGYACLENLEKTTDLKEWGNFITVLYDDILNNIFFD